MMRRKKVGLTLATCYYFLPKEWRIPGPQLSLELTATNRFQLPRKLSPTCPFKHFLCQLSRHY